MKMRVDVASRKFSFGFSPEVSGTFSGREMDGEEGTYLQNLCCEPAHGGSATEGRPSGFSPASIVQEFSDLFSSTLGTATCAPYEIELSDSTPVRSPPFRCAPPKLAIFKEVINELLEQGVIRVSKSLYASPAFLVPKRGGGYRMVVDYRKVNAKVIFDSYPTPIVEQTFEQSGGAVVFSVLHLNSAYYQIPVYWEPTGHCVLHPVRAV
jgi:hypothetical protein